LSKRVGVSPELLRAWERRYGLLQPNRSAGGFRLYSGADEARIQSMQRYLGAGLSAAEAARLAIAGADRSAAEPGAGKARFTESATELEDALARFDEPAAHAALDRNGEARCFGG